MENINSDNRKVRICNKGCDEMDRKEELNQHFNKIGKKLWINLAVNWFVPLVLVILLRSIYHNDTIALAIAGLIPIVRTAVIVVWRRRIDWIGVLGVLGFAGAFTVSTLSGGSSLPLKLYHPVVTGVIGLTFLGSVAIGKPLMVIILQTFTHSGIERLSNLESRKKLTNTTVLVGFVFIIEAVIHIVMALTLSTVTYLFMSRIVTLVGILVLVASRKLIVQRNK